MFPIKSISGIIGFGGRIIDSKKNCKIYKFSRGKIYNKSKTLYGIYESKQFIVKMMSVSWLKDTWM